MAWVNSIVTPTCKCLKQIRFTLNVSPTPAEFETRPFWGEKFPYYHEFDCDVTWRHIILHQWWFLPAFRIPRHNAMGYDLVTLKKFDFRELFDIVQMANLKEETLTVRYNDSSICGQRSFLGWNPILNHHWCVVRWRTSCLSRIMTAPPQTRHKLLLQDWKTTLILRNYRTLFVGYVYFCYRIL